MYKEFINKNVEIILAFSTYTLDGGASPEFYYGQVLDVTDSSITISLIKTGRHKLNFMNYNGETMVINTNYVIAVREVK